MITGMERAPITVREFVVFVLVLVMILIALLALSYVIGVCAGAVHVGYEWATS
jgi:hypothetical protein